MSSTIDQGKSSTGLDVNVAAALAYAGWFVSGIVLLAIEKESRFVRFHAMQSTIVFLAIAALHVVLQIVPVLGFLISLFIVFPLSVVLWILLMFKAYKGETYKLPIAGDIAEQKI